VDDRDGALYVATLPHSIRKVTKEGIVSTFVGGKDEGSLDGPPTTATFKYPHGIAIGNNGNMFVADYLNYKIRKVSAEGNTTVFAGSGKLAERGVNVDGAAGVAAFRGPHAVAVAHHDNSLYVVDRENHSIRKISANGHVSTFAGSGQPGFADSAGSQAQFDSPEGIAVGAGGTVYVVDRGNNRVRKITPEGLVSTFAGTGNSGLSDGPASSAVFSGPTDITIDKRDGSLFVVDQWWKVIRRISPEGQVSTVVGHPSRGKADGNLQSAGFGRITAMTMHENVIYVAEHHEIRKVTLF